MNDKTRVLILGGGFGGLYAALEFEKRNDPRFEVTVINRENFFREGKVVARNIIASVYGAQKKPFSFKTLGALAAIGRRTGVARILGVNFSGFLAWFLWRGIYWSKLPRTEKKVRVAIDWALDVLFTKDFVQFLDQRALATSQTETGAAPWNRNQLSDSTRDSDRIAA